MNISTFLVKSIILGGDFGGQGEWVATSGRRATVGQSVTLQRFASLGRPTSVTLWRSCCPGVIIHMLEHDAYMFSICRQIVKNQTDAFATTKMNALTRAQMATCTKYSAHLLQNHAILKDIVLKSQHVPFNSQIRGVADLL